MATALEEVGVAKRRKAAPAREGWWYPYLLIAPTMITLVVVALIPFLYAVFISFHEAKFGRIGEFAGFANYVELLTDERFWSALGVSLIFVLIAVPVEFMLGLTGALVSTLGDVKSLRVAGNFNSATLNASDLQSVSIGGTLFGGQEAGSGAIFAQAMRSLPTGSSRSHRSSRPVPRHSASARYTSPN